jgi:hypothetical protein
MSEARVERRRVPRYPASLVVEMEEGRGVTRDIGASGVYFETAERPASGATIRFTLILEHTDPAPLRLGCVGEVVRVEPRGDAVGGAAHITAHWIETSSP